MPGGQFRRLEQCASFVRSPVRVQRRLKTTFDVLRGDQLGPVKEEAHQTFRVRKDGKPLPLPPLLDPVVVEERSRWSKPKERPDVNKFTAFQKKLADTPYAHVLASPVRQCRVTGCLMPNDLLLSFTPRINPETSTPWLLPVSLAQSSKAAVGDSLRVSMRKPIVEMLGVKRLWSSHLDRRMIDKVGGPNLAKMIWREDMPDLVLNLLRKNLSNKLRWHLKGRLIPCASPRTEDLESVEDVSCVLYFGSLKTVADVVQARVQDMGVRVGHLANEVAEMTKALDPHKSKHVTHPRPRWWHGPTVPQLVPRALFPPLEFKTTGWRGSRVPVYSLCDLLGEEQASELLGESKYKGERTLVLKRARHNVPVELLLMQMQLYLAVPAP